MKVYESKTDEFEARVEVPDVWLSGHYDTYTRAYWEARAAEHMDALSRAAGVLALAIAGVVTLDIPGLTMEPEPDLTGLDARGLAVLRHVSSLIEATQAVPFGPSGGSPNGTKDKATES